MLNYTTHEAGAAYYRKNMEAISAATMEAIGQADAVLLGAMGLPDIRYANGTEIAPQIDMREHYGLFASLRPCRLFPGGVPTRCARRQGRYVGHPRTDRGAIRRSPRSDGAKRRKRLVTA